jgi:hypothetical protein
MGFDCIHGLNPEYCDHCRPKTLSKRFMPRFSAREKQYLGNPILEVLIDGNSWGVTYPYDEHFRFGVQKAKLILIFIDLIEEFVKTEGKRPFFNTTISRRKLKYNFYTLCTCSTSPSFSLLPVRLYISHS